MKQFVFLAAALLVVFMGSTAFGQPPRGSGGWGMKGSYQRMYNPATVETVKGEVAAVEKVTPMKGMQYGIHLMVKTDKETIPVHLGPAWFLRSEGIEVAKGDAVEVTGSLVDSNGQSFLVARELKKGERVVKLRDQQGVPVWAVGPRSR